MRILLISLLLIVGISVADWDPMWGYDYKMGTATADSIDSNVITVDSFSPDSIRAEYFSSPNDSLYFYTSNYNFYIRQAATSAGNRNLSIILVEEDGTEHILAYWSDINSRMIWPLDMYAGTTMSANQGANWISLQAAVTSMLNAGGDITINPGYNTFTRTVNMGANHGDTTRVRANDYFDCLGGCNIDTIRTNAVLGTIREVATNYTATLTDWQIVVTAAANITLPALSAAYDSVSASTGYGFQIDIELSVAEACTVIAAGSDNIDGGTRFVLTQWDNESLRATRDRWIVR